jgi:SAM-dependent methyltransferase
MRASVRGLIRRLVDVHVDVGGRYDQTVLDVGCGFGDLLIYFKERGFAVQGTDFSARAAAAAARYGVPVHVGPIEDVPLPEHSVDIAIMSHSLEHVPDFNATLRAVARLMRLGGELHIAVPNAASCGLAIEGADWLHISWPVHLWFFNAHDLSSILAGHGIEVEEITHRMTWPDHLRLWGVERVRCGWSVATWNLARVAIRGLLRPAERDILRIIAVRR